MSVDLTPEQLDRLCEKFAALSPAAQRVVFQQLLGEKAAIIAFTSQGNIYADAAGMLVAAELENPAAPHRGTPFP